MAILKSLPSGAYASQTQARFSTWTNRKFFWDSKYIIWGEHEVTQIMEAVY